MKDSELIRADTLGRVRVPDEQREALLDAYETSGLSGPQFAAQHGVNYQTFATWLQKRRRTRGLYALGRDAELGTSAFEAALPEMAEVELPVSRIAGPRSVHGDFSLELHLPGGAVVRMHREDQAGLLAALLMAMNKGAAC